MANMRVTAAKQLERNEQKLAKAQEEQRRIEDRPGHSGFKDASSRIKIVEDCEALDESIHKDKDRLADRKLKP